MIVDFWRWTKVDTYGTLQPPDALLISYFVLKERLWWHSTPRTRFQSSIKRLPKRRHDVCYHENRFLGTVHHLLPLLDGHQPLYGLMPFVNTEIIQTVRESAFLSPGSRSPQAIIADQRTLSNQNILCEVQFSDVHPPN